MKRILILTFVVILLGFGSKSFGFTLLDGKLSGSLILRNDSAWRLEDGLDGGHPTLEAGDYVLGRNTAELEFSYKAFPNLSISGVVRGWYDASLDLNSNLEDHIASYKHDRYEYSYDHLRELYVTVGGKLGCYNWYAKIGKQQIIWGESDGLRMADIINPLDLSWHYIFGPGGSWEEIRVPVWAIDFNYGVKWGPLYNIELVWQPGTFEFGFEGTQLAPEGANWGFPGYGQAILDAYDASEPEDSLHNSEAGARLHFKQAFGDEEVEFHLFYFYSRQDTGVLREDWLGNFLSGDKRKVFAYPFNNKIGGSFNYYQGKLKTVFRGECVFTIDEPFNRRDIINRPGITRRNTLAYMVGFDRPTWVKLLNPQRTFFLSVQFFQKWMPNWSRSVGNGLEAFSDLYSAATFFANTDYYRGRIQPGIFAVYEFYGGGWINPSISYKVANTPYLNCIVGIGSHILLSNNQAKGFFGPFRDNSEIYTWIEVSW